MGAASWGTQRAPYRRVETEQERWLKFFTEGESLDETHLPDWMQTDEMRQATSTLTAFSGKERAYHAYQAQQNYLREQRSIQRYLESLQAQTETLQAEAEQERVAKERERAAKEAALREKDAALAEIARLKASRADLCYVAFFPFPLLWGVRCFPPGVPVVRVVVWAVR
ncbi:MAG: hypothetical protein U5O69_04985 [Candidatus Competibacteraceae bacterium]|nr:hypothetical protein [Candidatus Competibacteraceae bacterium]